MNRKEIVLEIITQRKLKGHKPAVVMLKKNIGKIYLEGTADFILSFKENTIYFQRLSFLTKKLVPQKDFTLPIDTIKSYHLRQINIAMNCLSLYTADRNFIEIFYATHTTDTYESEQNIKALIQYLTEKGIKESRI